MVTGLYILFVIVAPLATLRLAPQRAVWWVYAVGLLMLPPSVYPPLPGEETFDWRIIGHGLPSDQPLSSAVVAAFAALLTAVLRGSRELPAWRPGCVDLPMALFCLWPVAQDLLVAGPSQPSGPVAALTFALVWGVPWGLARIYLADAAGRSAFVSAFAWTLAILAPFALIETATSWRLHEALIGPHPFAYDGSRRYFGMRPLLMFENGNQYGLYACVIALLAFALAIGQPSGWRRPAPVALAFLLALLALASQSVGAIGLALLGAIALLVFRRRRRLRLLFLGGAAAMALALAGYSTGQIPMRELAERTGVAAPAKALLDGMGRHSLAWRASQNDKTAELLREAQPLGHARWNWFAPAETRPWGFWSLLVGQFGLVAGGLLVLATAWAFTPVRRRLTEESTGRKAMVTDPGVTAFRVAAAVALLDAVLNSFIFYPVSAMIAACMADRERSRTGKAIAGDR